MTYLQNLIIALIFAFNLANAQEKEQSPMFFLQTSVTNSFNIAGGVTAGLQFGITGKKNRVVSPIFGAFYTTVADEENGLRLSYLDYSFDLNFRLLRECRFTVNAQIGLFYYKMQTGQAISALYDGFGSYYMQKYEDANGGLSLGWSFFYKLSNRIDIGYETLFRLYANNPLSPTRHYGSDKSLQVVTKHFVPLVRFRF